LFKCAFRKLAFSCMKIVLRFFTLFFPHIGFGLLL